MACRGHGGWRVREGPTAAVGRGGLLEPTLGANSWRVSREADRSIAHPKVGRAGAARRRVSLSSVCINAKRNANDFAQQRVIVAHP